MTSSFSDIKLTELQQGKVGTFQGLQRPSAGMVDSGPPQSVAIDLSMQPNSKVSNNSTMKTSSSFVSDDDENNDIESVDDDFSLASDIAEVQLTGALNGSFSSSARHNVVNRESPKFEEDTPDSVSDANFAGNSSSKVSAKSSPSDEDDQLLEEMLHQAEKLALKMKSAIVSKEGTEKVPKMNIVSSTPPATRKKSRTLGSEVNGGDAESLSPGDSSDTNSRNPGRVGSFATAGEFSQSVARTQIDAAEKAAKEMREALAALGAGPSLDHRPPKPLSPIPSPLKHVKDSRGVEWEHVEAPKETDEDFVQLKDYSKQSKPMLTPAKKSDASGVTWERVDYCESGDDDYVTMRDYSRQSSFVKAPMSRAAPNPSRPAPSRTRKSKRRRMFVILTIICAGLYFCFKTSSAWLSSKPPRVVSRVGKKPFVVVEQAGEKTTSSVNILEQKQQERQQPPPVLVATTRPKAQLKCQLPLAYLFDVDCSPIPRGAQRLENVLSSMMQ